MYINSGYLNNSLLDFQDTDNPLTIGSCGAYFLQSYPKLQTCRPNGRVDYQLLYISAGTAHFYFDNETNEIIVPSGTMVLYRPGEFQKYEYYGTEQTEVYWLHFTGNDIPAILQDYGIMDDMRVFYAGVSLEYAALFKRIIIELQRCHPGYPEMLVLLFRQMLLLISRQLTRERIPGNGYMDMEMDLATQYFNDNYHTDICIEKYAASRGMSVKGNYSQYERQLVYTQFQTVYRLHPHAVFGVYPHHQCTATVGNNFLYYIRNQPYRRLGQPTLFQPTVS